MHVFITGATGLIGSAVVAELLEHGHTVAGLARSDASAAALEAVGAEAVRRVADRPRGPPRAPPSAPTGSSTSPSATTSAAPRRWSESIADEGAAQAAMGEALVGSGKPYVVCSGTPWIAGRVSTEEDPLPLDGPVGGRSRTVNATLALAEQGVRTAAVRLPRTVHRDGEGGFAGLLTQIARQSGVSGYIGDGSQRWPAVHAADAASLFRLALEQAPAGSAWHAVDDEGDPVRTIAEVIGRRLAVPVEQVPAETYRPGRRDLRCRPARVERPHASGARLGADPPAAPRRPRAGQPVTHRRWG